VNYLNCPDTISPNMCAIDLSCVLMCHWCSASLIVCATNETCKNELLTIIAHMLSYAYIVSTETAIDVGRFR